jgi:hypothetical protein
MRGVVFGGLYGMAVVWHYGKAPQPGILVNMFRNAIMICASLLLAVPAGCGSGSSETPGSWGSRETNNVVALSLEPDTHEVDVCSAISNTVTVALVNSVINPSLPPNTLYYTRYTVSFSPLTSGAPPLKGDSGPVVALAVELPAEGISVQHVDVSMKRGYINDIALNGYSPAGQYPQYRADYVFSGTDLYGSSWGVRGSLKFRMGIYTTCPVDIQPEFMTVTGLNEIGINPSDDIKLSITGGIPPFSIYSDTTSVIPSPGALGNGVASYTIDPLAGTGTLVTLTVVDSVGSTDTAVINVVAP